MRHVICLTSEFQKPVPRIKWMLHICVHITFISPWNSLFFIQGNLCLIFVIFIWDHHLKNKKAELCNFSKYSKGILLASQEGFSLYQSELPPKHTLLREASVYTSADRCLEHSSAPCEPKGLPQLMGLLWSRGSCSSYTDHIAWKKWAESIIFIFWEIGNFQI